ncbi:conserved hypothetical protein [Neospora caninum Liverpool]|uniref:Rrp15p domain-containing protein n=1 Tax=Neospora caninum (strain Liverpool) TaxID=572307 RepID=F0VML8_NEOCL|nr:conserved hypothetical protein [Neospora caninum Liverpool]CBZ54964.1 conserved hypothetical protein [Neospora caninum Liverpool]CEL69686.1 TPA: hypothetical protein BN1204_053910 [Neospora caninum Liverpool]|eukprot:XP_003884992.1 conserved hypothetical protein [Neospora caninum Liverpool]
MASKRKRPLSHSSESDRDAESSALESDSGSEAGAASPETQKRSKRAPSDAAQIGREQELSRSVAVSTLDGEEMETKGRTTRKREPRAAPGEATDMSKAFQDIMSRPLPQSSPGRSERPSGLKRTQSDTCRASDAGTPETAPVLVERPGIFEELKKQKEEERVKRRLLAARRKQREASHVKPSAGDREYEKSLRKIASKGVVRFFNVLMKFRREQAEREGDETQLKRQRKRDSFTRRQKGRKMNEGDSRKTQNFMKMLKSEE